MAEAVSGPVGFLGLGNMGGPMVRNLLKGGREVLLYDIAPRALEAFAGAGEVVRLAGSPAEVGQGCALAITMLPDSEAVRAAVMAAPDGLARGMRKGGRIVDMSSSVPTETRRLGAELEALGLTLLDAPVSGGVPRARDGSLTIMAGGPADEVAAVEPVLAGMGTVQHVGPLGAGHAMKALNNFVSAAGLLAVSEALIVAARFGLDPHVMNQVLNVSTGRNNTTDRKVEQFMLNHAFNAGFTLDLMCKDVGIARDLAESLGLAPATLATIKRQLDAAAAALGPGSDHTAAYGYLEQALGAGQAD